MAKPLPSLESLRAAVAERPDDPRPMAQLAQALLQAVWKDTDRFTEYYREMYRLHRRLIRLEPGNPVHLVNIGVVQSDRGQHRDALRWFRRADAMGWIDGNLEYNIGIALVNLGQHEEGRRHMFAAAKKPRRAETTEAYFDPHAHG